LPAALPKAIGTASGGHAPRTSGPYYRRRLGRHGQGAAILENALKTEQEEIIRQLVATMSKQDRFAGGSRLRRQAAATDPKFMAMLIDQLSSNNKGLTSDKSHVKGGDGFQGRSGCAHQGDPHAGEESKGTESLDAAVDVLATLISADKLDAIWRCAR